MQIKILKFILWAFLITTSLCVRRAYAQSAQEINSIVNMIEDAVPKVVESVVRVDPSIQIIAIWKIEAGANQPIDVSLLEDQLTTALIRAGNFRRFQVMDRVALQVRAADLKLELPEVFDRRKMMQIGKALGVEAFLIGSAALTDEGLILDLKLVSTELGLFVWADRLLGHDKAAIAQQSQRQEAAHRAIEQQRLQKQLKSSSDAMLRSLLLPGWGQFYTKSSSRGLTYLFAEAISWGIFLQASSDEDESGTNTQKQIGLALIAVNHLVSGMDAVISTNSYNQKLMSNQNLSLQLNPRDKQIQLTYHRRF